MKEIYEADHTLAVYDDAVWFQGKNTPEPIRPDATKAWQQSIDRAVSVLGRYTTADQVVRMRARNTTGWLDLDTVDAAAEHRTDGFITTNPRYAFLAHPADCGEIAVIGQSKRTGTPAIGLFHASSKIVGEGGHVAALDAFCTTHQVEPGMLQVRLSPSARRGYRFPSNLIMPEQRQLERWKPYLHDQPNGLTHVDFHGLTVAELQSFGVCEENMAISAIDTITNPEYASYFREKRTGETPGVNPLLLALRGTNTTPPDAV